MTRGRFPLVGPWVIALSVSACGGSSPQQTTGDPASPPPAPAAAKPEEQRVEGPCGLFTKSEAEALLRAPIERENDEGPSRLKDVMRSSCFYRSDNGTVQVSLNQYDSPEVAGDQYTKMRKLYVGSDTHDVTGVGESAFWLRELLTVRDGEVHLSVKVDFNDEREIKSYSDKQAVDALIAIEREIAAKALTRVRTRSRER